jgi:putative endonuclease
MVCVYVLRSKRNSRLYVGQTIDVERRIEEHNNGRVQATRYQGPFQLIRVENFPTRNAAMKREAFLKTGKGREELKMLGLYFKRERSP